MVKHLLNVKILVFSAYTLLPGDKRKAFAQSQQEGLQVIQ